ncbi:hypothetical protein [Paracoccus sp. JM45]|uniref:hypothetical protein n=1 Tax=Paracoccus sp. JM45 TaxID=2283626 RepID=UPI001603E276|nr:hypothetical protein [Paracoccus sp. JM45]
MMTAMGAMFLTAALTTASGGFEEFASDANGWLLSGQGLPRDYRVTLMQMDSADRISAIAYLRRIGLMNDRPWTLDDLLRPAKEPAE